MEQQVVTNGHNHQAAPAPAKPKRGRKPAAKPGQFEAKSVASQPVAPPAKRGRPKGSKAKASPAPKQVVALRPLASLRLPDAGMAVVQQVLLEGATKYSGREWQVRPNDHLAKALGHVAAAINGVRFDPETGMSPLAHAAARLILALQIEAEKK